MKVDRHVIYMIGHEPHEFVALVGPHVVSFEHGDDGDYLWLNGTLIAFDLGEGSETKASEQFAELTGMFPYEMVEDDSIPRHGAFECSCPCNCTWRKSTDSHRMADDSEWAHRSRLPHSYLAHRLWGT